MVSLQRKNERTAQRPRPSNATIVEHFVGLVGIAIPKEFAASAIPKGERMIGGRSPTQPAIEHEATEPRHDLGLIDGQPGCVAIQLDAGLY